MRLYTSAILIAAFTASLSHAGWNGGYGGGSVSGALTGITSITGSGGAVLDLSGANPSWDTSLSLPAGYSVGSSLVTTAGGTRMAAGWRMMYGPNDGTADGYEVAAVYGSAYGWKSVPNGGTVVGSAEMNFSGTGFEVVDLYAARRLGARDDENPFVLRFGSKTTYTLSTGDAAMSGYATRVVIAAQSGTADDWDSASNAALTGTDGGFYYIQADAGDTITIRDASAGGTGGNIETTTGANIVLTGEALALAFWDETGSVLIVAPLF